MSAVGSKSTSHYFLSNANKSKGRSPSVIAGGSFAMNFQTLQHEDSSWLQQDSWIVER